MLTVHTVLACLQAGALHAPAVLAVLTLLAAIAYELRRRALRIPGFPQAAGVPLLGNLLAQHIAEHCRRWKYAYGDVFQIQLGELPVLVVNSAAAAKAIFLNHSNALGSRPNLWTFHEVIAKTQGATLGTAANSKTLMRSRKDAPLGKPAIKTYLHLLDVETKDFVQQCSETQGQPVDPLRMLQRMSLSFDLSLCWGRRISLSDPLLSEIVQVEHDIVEIRNTMTNYQDCFPFIRLPWTTTTRNATKLRDRRDTYYHSLNDDLDARLHLDPNIACIRADLLRSGVPQEELNLVCLTFISAGMAPTVAALQWSLAFLAQRPDIQAEAYAALQDHRNNGSILGDIDDDQGCSYIVALANECLRYFTPARCALPRSTVKDFVYQNNVVPAGTTVFLNAWACNMDPTVHTDPDSFSPSRFLANPPPPLFTYGLGSRSCSGSALAGRLLYLFFVRLIAAYEILPYDRVDVDPVSGCRDPRSLVSSPERYRIIFQERESVKAG